MPTLLYNDLRSYRSVTWFLNKGTNKTKVGNSSFSNITDAKVCTRKFMLSSSTLPCGQWASILHLLLWIAHYSYAWILQDKPPLKSEGLGMILSAFGNCWMPQNHNGWITVTITHGDWLVQNSHSKQGESKQLAQGCVSQVSNISMSRSSKTYYILTRTFGSSVAKIWCFDSIKLRFQVFLMTG